MRVIYNRIIPVKGFKSINIFGVLFVRSGCKMSDADFNHEAIHIAQMRELLYIPFYILYLIEWLWWLCRRGNGITAYYTISHEREAYANQDNSDYLNNRKHFNQFRQIWH